MNSRKAVVLYLCWIGLFVPLGIFLATVTDSALAAQWRGRPFRWPDPVALLQLDKPVFVVLVSLGILYGAVRVARNPKEILGKGSKKETLVGIALLPFLLGIAKFIGSY